MLLTTILDIEQREELTRLHATLSAATSATAALVADGVDLKWTHGALCDATVEVSALLDDQPYSIRDPERVVLTGRELL